jgi:hypothetical protein
MTGMTGDEPGMNWGWGFEALTSGALRLLGGERQHAFGREKGFRFFV